MIEVCLSARILKYLRAAVSRPLCMTGEEIEKENYSYFGYAGTSCCRRYALQELAFAEA